MTQLKVLIIGGGVAGNALAFWLSKVGHDITIVERFPELRASGLQVDLRSHGIQVLKRMGLEQAFRDNACAEEGLAVVDESGRKRAYFPANKSGKGAQGFTSEYEIMRGDLCRIIYNQIKDRVRYIFGTSVDQFEEDAKGVEVHFSNGTTERFDLLVGADGVSSRTRRMMLGSESKNTNYGFTPVKDMYIAYFTVPQALQEGEKYVATWHTAPGGRMMMTRRSKPHELQVYFGGKSDSERLKRVRPGDVEEEKAALAEAFPPRKRHGFYSAEKDSALEYLKQSKDFYCERLGQVKLDAWSKGRVALLGDAAYCPSAMSGMGTTSAVLGAYILAGEIAEHCGGEDDGGDNEAQKLRQALVAYEQRFSPFILKIQEGATDTSFMDKFSGPIGVGMLNCFMGLLSFLRINFFALARKEEIEGWELPEYAALK